MLNLTPQQINKIIERQSYLESEILGTIDKESKEYVLWTWGGQANFYKVNLWEALGLGEFCKENEEVELELNEDIRQNE
jgi:hypothetical protein